jgi:copper transport protein
MVLPQRVASDLRRGARGLPAALLALLLVLLTPRVARAHAAVVEADPEPGAVLASAPGEVVLRFTEPLNTSLSEVVVVTPSGQRIEGSATGRSELRAVIRGSETGVYEVQWRTVSTIDGHTLRGVFSFGVGVDPGEGAEGATQFGPGGAGVAVGLFRALEYAGLLTAVGLLLLRTLALRDPAQPWAIRSLRPVLWLALLGGVGVVVGEALLATPRPSVAAVVTFLSTGRPGLARLFRLGAEVLAVMLAARPMFAAGPVVGAIAALAAAGHAAAVRPVLWGVSIDAIHLLAAGLWAGGILALALVRPAEGWRSEGPRRLLDRFTPVAFVAFLVTVATGVLRGTQELISLTDLLTTSYGAVLTFKVLAVAAMVPLSLLAWRRIVGSPRWEALTALVVVGAASFLAAYPLPPARTAESEGTESQAAETLALPRRGELSLADGAGDVLVGLTVRPGRPGPNALLVYVLPPRGEEAAAGVPVRVRIEGRPLRTQDCGQTCRRAFATLAGGETVEVQVRSPIGGAASFELPKLPASAGRSLFDRAQARMHELRTYRLREMFGPVDPPLRSTYSFEAPDRMAIEADTGSASIFIGRTRYRRIPGQDTWSVERGGPPVEVPSFIWDRADLLEPFLLGTERIGPLRVRVLTVFGMSGRIPIWFRLWVDQAGLVLQAEMRAQGHFMDHRYFAFDEPVEVKPPVRGAG